MKSYDEVINKINQSIVELKKNHDDIIYTYYLYRARIYEKLHKYKEALRDVDLSIEMEPDAYLVKIRLLISLKKYYEALDFIDELITSDEIYTYCKEVYYQKSYVLFLLEKYDQALKNANDLIALDPKGTSGYRIKVMILYKLNKYDEGDEVVSNALLYRSDKERLRFFKSKKIRKSDTIYSDLDRLIWLGQLDVNNIESLLKKQDEELLISLRLYNRTNYNLNIHKNS